MRREEERGGRRRKKRKKEAEEEGRRKQKKMTTTTTTTTAVFETERKLLPGIKSFSILILDSRASRTLRNKNVWCQKPPSLQ